MDTTFNPIIGVLNGRNESVVDSNDVVPVQRGGSNLFIKCENGRGEVTLTFNGIQLETKYILSKVKPVEVDLSQIKLATDGPNTLQVTINEEWAPPSRETRSPVPPRRYGSSPARVGTTVYPGGHSDRSFGEGFKPKPGRSKPILKTYTLVPAADYRAGPTRVGSDAMPKGATAAAPVL